MAGLLNSIKKFYIYYANLDPTIGSEQSGIRPVLIIQNDTSNKYSPVTIVAAFTTKARRIGPVNILIKKEDCNLPKDSILILNQIRTIDKKRLVKYIGKISDKHIQEKIDEAIKISLDIN